MESNLDKYKYIYLGEKGKGIRDSDYLEDKSEKKRGEKGIR